MAFISSKFTMPNFAGSGVANAQAWADLYLTNIATAFTAANAAWSVYSAIETIGTNTNTNYGCRTIQLKSSISNKFVRIWCFSNGPYGYVNDTPGTSGGYSNINCYAGNVMRVGSNSIIFVDQNGYGEVYFAVSDNSIDADFAKDLGLSVPMFGLYNNSRSMGYTTWGYTSGGVWYNGGTLSIVSDGKYFGVMRVLNGETNLIACFYAPDMLICANGSDTDTEGVVTCENYNDNLYFGTNDAYNAEGYIKVLFNAADGTHDFRGWTEGIYNGKDGCQASADSSDMPCTALKVFLNIQNYSGSTLDGVLDGISLKGWVNPDYMRSANNTVLPAASKNMTYGNGAWLCTDAGTLICWDSTNSSPFEAAT